VCTLCTKIQERTEQDKREQDCAHLGVATRLARRAFAIHLAHASIIAKPCLEALDHRNQHSSSLLRIRPLDAQRNEISADLSEDSDDAGAGDVEFTLKTLLRQLEVLESMRRFVPTARASSLQDLHTVGGTKPKRVGSLPDLYDLHIEIDRTNAIFASHNASTSLKIFFLAPNICTTIVSHLTLVQGNHDLIRYSETMKKKEKKI